MTSQGVMTAAVEARVRQQNCSADPQFEWVRLFSGDGHAAKGMIPSA